MLKYLYFVLNRMIFLEVVYSQPSCSYNHTADDLFPTNTPICNFNGSFGNPKLSYANDPFSLVRTV
jgi:hypothetical protein